MDKKKINRIGNTVSINDVVWRVAQKVFRYGREPNLSDVPMTYMTRSEAFKKRGFSRKKINKLWEQSHKQ